MSMAERTLFEVIRDALSFFTDASDTGQRFERLLLTQLRLSEEESAKARLYFAGGTNLDGEDVEARPPTLLHGYARTGGPFPCWAITLGAEQETQVYLGNDAPFLSSDGELFYDPETGDVVNPKARRVQYTFNIHVIADHPDITLYYYHLLKYIVFSNYQELIDQGLDDLSVSGADLVPDPRYLPSDVFARQLTVSFQAEECWSEVIDSYATQVEGIAVDDTGEESTSGVGSVKARVSAYVENG